MAVNLKKVHGLAAYSKELAIFVEDCGVTEAISKKNFHYSRCKGCSQGIGNRFHASKTTHAATANEVYFGSLQLRMFHCTMGIKMNNQKQGFDREPIDQFGGFAASGV
jgi:hypothetical protein